MDMVFKLINKYRVIVILVFLLVAYYFLYKIYTPKINAFGCFDDCANFVEGYFITKGKILYSQIYNNHMPLIPYISAFIQHFGNSINIYEFVLQHRQALLLYSFVFNFLLMWRFGLIGGAFMIVYEFSKFYVFGDRFLAEGFIVYPIVYLTGLGLHTLLKRRIYLWEYIFTGICLWYIVFMREPYILAAIFLAAVILRPVAFKKIGLLTYAVGILLSVSLFLLFPFRDFIDNVIILNANRGLSTELQAGNFFGSGIIRSFFYPINLLFDGRWNDFRIQLIYLSVGVIGCLTFLVRAKRTYWLLGFLFVALGLANLRPTTPGLQYFDAFHQINWYGMFLFSFMYLLYEVSIVLKKPIIFFGVTGILIIYVLFSPRSFIYQKVDGHGEFITNYGPYLQLGEIIKGITTPDQTLFTNGSEEFLYIASGRSSSYPYSFYYPWREKDKYFYAAQNMYKNNPPDVIYDFCSPDAPIHPYLPQDVLPMYAQWYSEGKPTCLYIKKSLVPGLTKEQKDKAMEFLYYLPE